jgi:hypothetical protein
LLGIPDNLKPSELNPDDLLVREKVNIPVYSEIHWQSTHTTQLVATMSVRNIDLEKPIYLIGVATYDSSGAVIRAYVREVIALGPMATTNFVIPYSDQSGGAGANFVVEWGANAAMSDPIIETVMFGQAGNAGISFTSRGTVIADYSKLADSAEE